jgi:hypothetical protein
MPNLQISTTKPRFYMVFLAINQQKTRPENADEKYPENVDATMGTIKPTMWNMLGDATNEPRMSQCAT